MGSIGSMNRTDTLHAAAKVAESLVRVNNALMDNRPATSDGSGNGRVEFYQYHWDWESTLLHFRFEATRHEYVIHDMLMGATELYRTNQPDRALNAWTEHILGYIHE